MQIKTVSFFLVILPLNAHAQNLPAPRAATETEIRSHLKGSSDLKPRKDGFEYKAAGKIGYQFSTGKICIKQNQRVKCSRAVMIGDGLQVTDPTGHRDFLK